MATEFEKQLGYLFGGTLLPRRRWPGGLSRNPNPTPRLTAEQRERAERLNVTVKKVGRGYEVTAPSDFHDFNSGRVRGGWTSNRSGIDDILADIERADIERELVGPPPHYKRK